MLRKTLRYASAAVWIAAAATLTLASPMGASAANGTHMVDCHSLVIRDTPGGGEAVGYASEGTCFYISKTSGDWLYTDCIAGTNGKTISGWLYAPLCTGSDGASSSKSSGKSNGSAASVNKSSGSRVVVTAAVSVTMRSGAGSSYEAIDWIKNGVELELLGSSGGFYQVKYGGKTGWISSQFAEPVTGKVTVSTSSTSSVKASGSRTSSKTLSWQKAYDYAEQHCYYHNPEYRYYENGNCMTYISQILVAGGLAETNEFRDESLPFVRISEFIPYMKRTYGVSRMNYPSLSNIKKGDCVLTDDGVHIMWVLSVDAENGCVYACGNTNDRWYYKLDAKYIDAVVTTSQLF